MDLDEKVQEKDPLYFYDGKIKKVFYYNEPKTNNEINDQFNGKKRQCYLRSKLKSSM